MTAPARRAATTRLGLTLALCAEAMFFLALVGAVLVLQKPSPAAGVAPPVPWPNGIWLVLAAFVVLFEPVLRRRGAAFARIACGLILLGGAGFLFWLVPVLHLPSNPSSLVALATILAWALGAHVLLSILFTLPSLLSPAPFRAHALWIFAAVIWGFAHLLL